MNLPHVQNPCVIMAQSSHESLQSSFHFRTFLINFQTSICQIIIAINLIFLFGIRQRREWLLLSIFKPTVNSTFVSETFLNDRIVTSGNMIVILRQLRLGILPWSVRHCKNTNVSILSQRTPFLWQIATKLGHFVQIKEIWIAK